jgi:DNA repair exonuclease SbcCD ATPase subunit
MTQAFQVAKEQVLATEQAWSHLDDQLTQIDQDILSLQASLQALATTQGQSNLTELGMVRQTLMSLRDRIDQDPLGASIDLAQSVQPILNPIRAKLEKLAQQQDQIRQTIAQKKALLQQLTDLHQQTLTTFAERREKVVNLTGFPTPLPQEQLDGLRQWLTRLETKFTEGLLDPVQVGLENWTANAKEQLAREQATYTANATALNLRMELRGRLDALKAKAFAKGLAEDTILMTLAEQAKQLLYARPTPLDQAVDLVAQYERELSHRV